MLMLHDARQVARLMLGLLLWAVPTQALAEASDARVVFDLLQNRPLSHRRYLREDHQVSFALEASSPDLVRYMQGGHPEHWSVGAELEEEPAAWMRGKRAALWIPSWAPGQAQRLTLRLYGAHETTLRARYNGRKLEERTLRPGWQTVSWALPSRRSQVEDELELEVDSLGERGGQVMGAGLGWLWLGEAEPEPHLLERDEGPRAQGEWRVKPRHGLAWSLWVPPGESSLAMTLHGPAGCELELTAWQEDSAGALVERLKRRLTIPEGQRELRARVPLEQLAGPTGELARVALDHGHACDGRALSVSVARVELAQAAPKPTPIPPPKHIILWKVDTLRADHLPPYGDAVTIAPAYTRLAQEGALFKLAFVQGNESRVSHASMFSGQYPARHGVAPAGKLSQDLELLPEAMKALGLKTLGRASNGYVSKPYGYEQGWDSFQNDLRDDLAYDGKSIVRRALSQVRAHADEPFFFYLGTIDPHATYRRHDGIFERYQTPRYTGRFKRTISGKNLGEINQRLIEVSPEDKAQIQALYRNEITYSDEAFAMLRQELEALGMWSDTLLVMTSDHGDGFWEHRKVGHGHNLHQELVHVPLIMVYPRAIPAGTIIEAGVDVLDIYPTLVEALGGQRPPGLQGKSLWPLIQGVEDPRYPQPATSNFELKRDTMQLGPYKLIWERSGAHTLYDRRADPLELEDVQAARPLAKRWLLDAMSYQRHYVMSWDKQRWGVPNNLSAEFLMLSQDHHEALLIAQEERAQPKRPRAREDASHKQLARHP